MKQSEKDKIIEIIDMCRSGDIVVGKDNHSVINMTGLLYHLNNLPTEPDDITEVYAIKDCITGEVIWNAHGCPYKFKVDAEKKIRQLQCLRQNQFKAYQLLTFKLDK
jgi:hypothetical protein